MVGWGGTRTTPFPFPRDFPREEHVRASTGSHTPSMAKLGKGGTPWVCPLATAQASFATSSVERRDTREVGSTGAPTPGVEELHMAAPSIPLVRGVEEKEVEEEGGSGALERYVSETANKWGGNKAAVAREYRHLVTVKGRRGEVL